VWKEEITKKWGLMIPAHVEVVKNIKNVAEVINTIYTLTITETVIFSKGSP